MWVVGFAAYRIVSATLQPDLYPDRWPISLVIIGGPAVVTFGVIVTITAARVIGLRFKKSHWIGLVFASVLIGFLYALIVPRIGSAFFDWPGRIRDLLIEDSSIFLVYVIWFALLATILSLGEQRESQSFSTH